MKARFPLYAKILTWFFLNIIVLGVVGWLIVRAHVKTGVDSFLSGYISQRVEPLAREVIAELSETSKDDWGDILKKRSEKHGVTFCLTLEGERGLFGSLEELPDELRKRLPKGPPRGGQRDRPPPRRQFNEDGPGAESSGEQGGPLEAQQPPDLRPGPLNGPFPIHQRFLLRTENPEFYWVGLQTRFTSADGNGGAPGALFIRSETFSAGGLFFDYTPWFFGLSSIVFVSALFWLPLVGSITRSVSRVTKAAEQIAEGQFEVQVDTKRRDEIGRLSDAINRMAGRLAGFVQGQKRFLGDTAHELCAPIARMQMALGILEQRADEKQKPYVDDVREELQHMSGLVNELLSFSKAGLRPKALKLKPLSVLELAQKVIAREVRDPVKTEINIPENMLVLGEKDLLIRAIGNVVRNAVRYASNGGPIQLAARTVDEHIEIIISDHGPGVPEDDVTKLFDPFFRVDTSRDRETGGVGLGLTIVKTCIEACGGTVSARNRKSGGLRVILRLKRALEDDSTED
jgi:two-component system sensor histidine kinase CpxA